MLFAAGLVAQSNPAAPMPEIRRTNGVAQMYVDGRPYVMLAGELHNSSASSIDYMRPVWNRLSALHLNTVIGTVSWELLEPEEDKFDFNLVDAQIREARIRNMRLVLIWFATWKNAESTYTPLWVKADTKRFPRMVKKQRPDLKSRMSAFFAESMAAPNLTPFGEESLAADAKAFRALMRHIREVDPQHTVIMMQVENESGLLGDTRDRSPMAEAAWARTVPAELMGYLVKNKESLLPELREVWGANGSKRSGTWAEVFGTGNYADEVFMVWHVGRYIGKIIEAGKAELPLPMYVNAWLGPQPDMEQPGQYPSGGPVARMMDVWRAAAPRVALLAPDIYVRDFKGTCALYARSGNPLFIPEARAVTGDLFWALGQHAALGFAPFGIEDVKEDHQLAEAYRVLGEMIPVLAKAQTEQKVVGILMDTDEQQKASLAGYGLQIRSSRRRVAMAAGEAPPDAGGFGPPPADSRPFGMVLATAPDEFVVVGSGFAVNFSAEGPAPKTAEIGWIDEGRFERGQWIRGRRMNGDEGCVLLRGGPIGMLKVKLLRRD